MFDHWLKLPAHLYLRLTALLILTVGIAVSNVLMSIGTIWIISNWILELDFKTKWVRLKNNKSIWVIIFLYFLFVLSLFWSENVAYGFHDLRIKLPFIVIPLVLASSTPIQKNHRTYLSYIFIGIVCYTSLYNFIRYNYFLDFTDDIRQMSTFISHVRFSILVNLAFFIVLYCVYKKRLNRFLGLAIVCWLFFYLFKSQIVNGYLLFLVLSIYSIVFLIYHLKNRVLKWFLLFASLSFVLVVCIVGINTVKSIKSPVQIDFNTLETYSPDGNEYYHDTLSTQAENGNLIWLYFSEIELRESWNKRAAIKYDSLDNKQQRIYGTIIRYLTSKGMRKDRGGVEALTDEDVKRIENGQTAYDVNNGINSKLVSFVQEYEMYTLKGDPNGYSILQRLEHFKAAKRLVQSVGVFGVGIGDVDDAFKAEYQKMQSKLLLENQHRAHNQFLTIWITLGIVGLSLFIAIFILPLFEIKKKNYIFLLSLFTLAFSCIFQDLIETQAGVTMFALVYGMTVYREED